LRYIREDGGLDCAVFDPLFFEYLPFENPAHIRDFFSLLPSSQAKMVAEGISPSAISAFESAF